MKVCATVLLGPGCESIVGDAVKSVLGGDAAVDGFVFVDAGGGPSALSDAALDLISHDAWHASSFDWTGSYSDARNHALDCARRSGYDWALTLDTDERIELPTNWRETLESQPSIHVWMIRDRDEGYAKERFLRCSSDVRWHGRVCENVLSPAMIMGGRFWELPKTPEQHDARYRRGIVECHRMIHDDHDDRFKWWRHMGTCYAGIGNTSEAERCYRQALSRAVHPEDRAWCSYLICELMVLRQCYQEARDMAARELAFHAGFLPEFGWILAYTQFKLGDPQNASRWAQLVTACPPDRTRVGNRGKQCQNGALQLLAYIHGENNAQPSSAREL